MRFRWITNKDVARSIFLALGVIICLGAFYSLIERDVSSQKPNSSHNPDNQNPVPPRENLALSRPLPAHTALVTISPGPNNIPASQPGSPSLQPASTPPPTYLVDLATSSDERSRGLCCRETIGDGDPDKQGMLFVFGRPDRHSFWMKDTLIPLDIIWISADKDIIHIERNVQPETFPSVFTPKAEALYVLEVSAGEALRNNFQVGDQVSIWSAEIR